MMFIIRFIILCPLFYIALSETVCECPDEDKDVGGIDYYYPKKRDNQYKHRHRDFWWIFYHEIGPKYPPKKEKCNCTPYKFTCNKIKWTCLQTVPPRNTTNELNLIDMKTERNELQYLQYVDMSLLTDLLKADFTNSAIDVIPTFTFRNQQKLTTLILAKNKISHLQEYVFFGLKSLTTLDLSGNNLYHISDNVFTEIRRQLSYLNLEQNSLTIFNESDFSMLNLNNLNSDNEGFCCLGEYKRCNLKYDDISSCNKYLVTDKNLCFLMGMIGIGGLIANFYIILRRTLSIVSNIQSLMAVNLAISDFFMSIYVTIIFGTDQHYGDKYRYSSEDWKLGSFCKLSGSIFATSSEYSIIILLLMSFHAATTATGSPSLIFNRKRCYLVILFATAWCTAIGFLPYISYFDVKYYGRHAMCSPLPFTNDKFSGSNFATVIFFIFNLHCFIVIIGFLSIAIYFYSKPQSDVESHEGEDKEVGNENVEGVGTGNESFCNTNGEDVGSGNEDVWNTNENVDCGNKNVLVANEDVGSGKENDLDTSGENVGSTSENVWNANENDLDTSGKNVGPRSENVWNANENASSGNENVWNINGEEDDNPENDNVSRKIGEDVGTGSGNKPIWIMNSENVFVRTENAENTNGKDVVNETENDLNTNGEDVDTGNEDDGNVDNVNQKTNEPGIDISCTPIVIINACCWLAVILMGIVSRAGGWENMQPGLYEWSTAFIIPVRVIINPFLYKIYLRSLPKEYIPETPPEIDPNQLYEHALRYLQMD